jgi:hypothetical protein
VRTIYESNVIKADLQSRFRSGVGMMINLIKHPRPDIENVIRELTKCKHGATLAVLYTKLFSLKTESKKDE